MRLTCKKCEHFQARQGKGKAGNCFRFPITVEKTENTRSCGEFKVNLDKYHVDGKKIYTRVDTKNFKAKHDTYAGSIKFNMNDTGSGLGR